MFANINNAALQALGRFVADPDADLPRILAHLRSRTSMRQAYNTLDANGDGVTIDEVFNYSGVGSAEIKPFLTTLQQELALGAGGENSIPTLSFSKVTSLSIPADPATVRTTLVGFGAPGVGQSGIRLQGFGDGTIISRTGATTFKFRRAAFQGDIQPVSQSSTAWTGLFGFIDPQGNQATAVLIGLLLPSATGHQFDAVVIPTACAGRLWGADGGVGDLQLNFGKSITEPFTGGVKITPLTQ